MMAWLSNLRLSLAQWALLTLGSLCGALVVVLRLQGSLLHKARIEALASGLKYRNVARDEKVDKLRDKLEQEIFSYEQSKK